MRHIDLRKNSGGDDSGPGQFVMVPTSPKPSRQSSQKCAGFEKKVERTPGGGVSPKSPVQANRFAVAYNNLVKIRFLFARGLPRYFRGGRSQVPIPRGGKRVCLGFSQVMISN